MKLLRPVDICGRKYRVVSASEEENPELSDKHGLCDFEASTIWIRSGVNREVEVSILLHEMLHAAINATAMDVRLPGVRLEEDLVRALTAALRPALVSAGWTEPKALRVPRKKASK